MNLVISNKGKLKKLNILLLIVSFFTIGCTRFDNVRQSENTNEITSYCSECGVESQEKTKFCSNCGSQAVWLDEKPQILKENENVNNKDDNYTYKYEYLAKLEDLDEEVDNSSSLLKEESSYTMIDREKNNYEKWDNMLNEIYCLLETQLSNDEFQAFKNKQHKWLNYRDSVAQNQADKFEGMVFTKVQYNLALAKLTKERCYEIVNNYL
ncbi:lysozyme inhibitor LprI family protein [Terrisporobacter sp.]